MTATRKHSVIFETDSTGIPTMANREDFLKFFAQFPERSFKGEIKLVRDGEQNKLRAYYFAEVVTKYIYALRGCGYSFGSQDCHDFIKQFSPVMDISFQLNGKHYPRYRSITDSDFTNADFLEYIEDLKRFAAEEFSIIINDPTKK